MADQKKDVQKSLASSQKELAQVSKLAEGIKKGTLPPTDVFKIPEQVAKAQGLLKGLEGDKQLDKAKGKTDDAAKAAEKLKAEATKKLPAPIESGKDALKGLGKQIGAAGVPLKDMAKVVPGFKLPLGEASTKAGALKKKPVPAAKVKQTVPDIKGKMAPPTEGLPKMAAQLDPVSETVKDLTGQLDKTLKVLNPLLDAPPLAKSLKKAGTTDAVKTHLKEAQDKLKKVPPLIAAAKKAVEKPIPPLLQAAKKLDALHAEAVAVAPPPPNPPLENLQQQLQETATAVGQAAAPVNAAVANLPSAQQKIEQAQAIAAKASDQMKPEEIKQAMDQITQLVTEAQQELAGPAADMPASAALGPPIQDQLASIQDAAPGTLVAAAALAPPEQQIKAAELFGHAQEAVNPLPAQMAEAAPAVQDLAPLLEQLLAPLAELLKKMNDALNKPQKDMADLERMLAEAEAQMTAQAQQVEEAAKKLDESIPKVDTATKVEDPLEMKKAIDEIEAGLPQLDDKAISDLEKKLPELEALVAELEKSGGAA